MAEVCTKNWWAGPWGSAIRQIYVTMAAEALTAGLNKLLTMDTKGKGLAFLVLIMVVKGSEKAIREGLANWIANRKVKVL
jgi:hypothetical protein